VKVAFTVPRVNKPELHAATSDTAALFCTHLHHQGIRISAPLHRLFNLHLPTFNSSSSTSVFCSLLSSSSSTLLRVAVTFSTPLQHSNDIIIVSNVMSDKASDSGNAAAATGTAPQFTEREMVILSYAWRSLKSGPPEVPLTVSLPVHHLTDRPRSTTRSSPASSACPTLAQPQTPGRRSRPS
jgi:hypothetical protein